MEKKGWSKMTGFTEVSQKEIVEVDGGGISGAIIGAVTGATTSGFLASCQCAYAMSTGKSTNGMGSKILSSMRDGAITGAMIGLISPNP